MGQRDPNAGTTDADGRYELGLNDIAEAGDVFDVRVGESAYRLLVSVHPAATLYDRSQAETFETTIARAAELSGVGNGEDGQSRLGEF